MDCLYPFLVIIVLVLVFLAGYQVLRSL